MPPGPPAATRSGAGDGRRRGRRVACPPTSSPRLRQSPPRPPGVIASRPGLAFDFGPGTDPVVVVHAVGFPAFAAFGQRRLPVVDVLPEGRFFGMVFLAEGR